MEKILTKCNYCTEDICENELILCNQQNGTIAVLNKSAAMIWNMMSDYETYNVLAEKVYQMFNPPPPRETFDVDFEGIISYLQEHSLIKVSEECCRPQ